MERVTRSGLCQPDAILSLATLHARSTLATCLCKLSNTGRGTNVMRNKYSIWMCLSIKILLEIGSEFREVLDQELIEVAKAASCFNTQDLGLTVHPTGLIGS